MPPACPLLPPAACFLPTPAPCHALPVWQLRAAFLAADGASALRELLDNPSDRVSCGQHCFSCPSRCGCAALRCCAYLLAGPHRSLLPLSSLSDRIHLHCLSLSLMIRGRPHVSTLPTRCWALRWTCCARCAPTTTARCAPAATWASAPRCCALRCPPRRSTSDCRWALAAAGAASVAAGAAGAACVAAGAACVAAGAACVQLMGATWSCTSECRSCCSAWRAAAGGSRQARLTPSMRLCLPPPLCQAAAFAELLCRAGPWSAAQLIACQGVPFLRCAVVWRLWQPVHGSRCVCMQ